MSYRSTVTSNQINITLPDGMHVLNRDHICFQSMKNALSRKAPIEDIRALLSPDGVVKEWSEGRFLVRDGRITDVNGPIPQELERRIFEAIKLGNSPVPIFNFWSRLNNNPSHRSVNQLWNFMQACKVPLTDSGFILAYKGVRSDLKDKHSGTFENRPGKVLTMARNKVSDDPNEACHYGFHVGSLSYASSFAERVVICKVDPADVVCIPYDHGHQKMRCCRYEVVGFQSGALDENLVHDADLPDNTDITVLVDDDDRESEKESQRKPLPATGVERKDLERILSMDMDELRRFARQDLKIVGANKMAGGKVALLEVVLSNFDKKKS